MKKTNFPFPEQDPMVCHTQKLRCRTAYLPFSGGDRAAFFTLIELLVVIAIIAILFTSENNFLVSVYVNGVLEKVCGTNRYHV